MAREAVKVELTNSTGMPRRFTAASSGTILKGTFLKFADPRTASASTGTADAFAGICAVDKASGATSITAWTDGIFELYASGAITAGDAVQTAAPGNYVMAIPNSVSGALVSQLGAKCVGYAMETATAGEVINVRVRL